MFILRFLFYLFLFAVILVLIFVARIALTIWRMKRELDKRAKNGARYDTTADGTSSTTGQEGEILTDMRDPQRAHRKIIADDEGEYVEFEEE